MAGDNVTITDKDGTSPGQIDGNPGSDNFWHFGEKEILSNTNIVQARIQFSERVNMFYCKMNYQNDPVFKEQCWTCDSCQSAIDDMAHVMVCPAYQPLRQEKDMNLESDILEYLVAVSKIRAKLGLRR